MTKLGRPDLATEAMGIYQGDVYVNLHPEAAWTTGRNKDGLIEAMADALGEMPGVAVNFTQPMAMRLDEVVSGVKADVAVKVFGEDSRRAGAARRAECSRVLARVPGAPTCRWRCFSGAVAAADGRSTGEAIARYGLNVADVQRRGRDGRRRHRGHRVLDGAATHSPWSCGSPKPMRADARRSASRDADRARRRDRCRSDGWRAITR